MIVRLSQIRWSVCSITSAHYSGWLPRTCIVYGVIHLPFNVFTHSWTKIKFPGLCCAYVCCHAEMLLVRSRVQSHIAVLWCILPVEEPCYTCSSLFSVLIRQRRQAASCQSGRFILFVSAIVLCVVFKKMWHVIWAGGRGSCYVWPACLLVPKECLKKCHLSVFRIGLLSLSTMRMDTESMGGWIEQSKDEKDFHLTLTVAEWKLLCFRHGSISRSRVCKPQGPVPSSYFMMLISVSIRMDTTSRASLRKHLYCN